VLGLELGHSAAALLGGAALLLAWGEPLASEIRVGNVNQLQLGGVALFALARRLPAPAARELVSGALLGALVAFKPTLALAPLLLLWTLALDGRTRAVRSWPAALGGAAIASRWARPS
jgi:hypothetical protein